MSFETIDTAIDVIARNNVTVRGTGRPMVFAHGFGCSQGMWRLLTPYFDDHRTVLFDLVGAGDSDPSAYRRGKYDTLDGYATDLLEILEALDLHDVVFVGHSVSAMIGLLAANRDPSRFGALMLLSPSPHYLNDGDYLGGFEPDDIEQLLDALDANHIAWSGSMAPIILNNPEAPALEIELTDSFCSTDPAIARHFARVTFLSDNRDDLRAVTVPTLVMQSQDDLIAPTAVGEFVSAAIPGSTLTYLPVKGHCPHLSGPHEVAAAIREFLG